MLQDKTKKLQGLNILLAEDSADGALLVTLYLQAEGAQVQHVTNGAAAVQAALQGNFDLILMDVQMPGLDGLEATRQLRARNFLKPIFALTAHALREEIAKSKQAGCHGHITKPINRGELISTLAETHSPFSPEYPLLNPTQLEQTPQA